MSNQPKKFGRRSYLSVLEKGLRYIEKRRSGEIKSFRTPWPGFNLAGVAGLEWGSMFTIGARPGAGKTMLVSQILREASRLNPDQKFNILEFQFEMGDEQYAARQFAGETALDYGIILSTTSQLQQFVVDHINRYIQDVKFAQSQGIIREMISQPLTYHEIEEAIKEAYVDGGNKPLIVTIDHSWLIKKSSGEKDKFDVLYNTAEMLMKLKNQIPIIVIMVTQLNRSIDDSARKAPGTIANYPTSSDIFGGDALMQSSDMVAVLANPHKSDIPIYGPHGYEVKEDDILLHLLKVRNGSEKKNIVFLKMEGKSQRMIEVPEFKATKTPGSYVPFTVRTGRTGRPDTSAPIGTEI